MAKKKVRKTTKFSSNVREVNWVLCLVMSVVFGWIGVRRFMVGKAGTGILNLMTIGGLGIWRIVDLILISTKYDFKNVKWAEYGNQYGIR